MVEVNGVCFRQTDLVVCGPPVFTHKQCNLQLDQLVWVWLPVSHSLATLATQTRPPQGSRRSILRPLTCSRSPFQGTMLIWLDKRLEATNWFVSFDSDFVAVQLFNNAIRFLHSVVCNLNTVPPVSKKFFSGEYEVLSVADVHVYNFWHDLEW